MIARSTQQWGQIRTRGKNAFLWRKGICQLGLPLALGMTVAQLAFKSNIFADALALVLGNLAGAFVFGLLYCNWVWKKNETQYSDGSRL